MRANRWQQLFTGKDNQTLDIGRVVIGVGVLGIFALTGVSLAMGAVISLMEFAGALATVSGISCAGIAVKSHTEPDAFTEASVVDDLRVKVAELADKMDELELNRVAQPVREG
jgi:hypothetical protein